MATTRNHRIRFMENNLGELTNQNIEFSSELSSFPFTNAINPFRSRVWKPQGCFRVTDNISPSGIAPNNKLYINDGADKTITLTPGDYTSPQLFATHVQTQLNASSSNWTVSYDSAGGTYKFTISNTGSVTLKLSSTTDAGWSLLGYTLPTDQTGTSFVAQEQRNHWPHEYVTWDLGTNTYAPTFFSIIGPLDEALTISSQAVIKLQASNLSQWSTAPFEVTIGRTDKGALRFLDDIEDTGYRFWRLTIEDPYNYRGPDGLSFGHIYLGDYTTITNRNVSSGFVRTDVDPSRVDESESGVLHFDRKTKYRTINSTSIQFLDRSAKDELTLMFERLGKTTPFYVSLDPTLCTTDTLDELTLYVVFAEEPVFRHIKNDIYSMTLSFREVV